MSPGSLGATADPSPESSCVRAAPSRGRVLLRVVACGLAALLAAFLARTTVNAIGEVFQLAPDMAAIGSAQNVSTEDQDRYFAARLSIQSRNATVWLGTAGAILGGLLGLALACFQRPVGKALIGVICGALGAAAGGAAGGYLSVMLEHVYRTRIAEAVVPETATMLWPAAAWLMVGAGSGLGTAFGAAGVRLRTILGTSMVAMVAGALGGAIFPFVAGVALPLANTALTFPDEPGSLLLWLSLPSVLIGLAIGRRG